MFSFFRRKEKPVIEVNEFSKHLPPDLYLFLQQYDLLNDNKREFTYIAASGSKSVSWVQIEITNKPVLEYDSFISIRLYRHEDNKYIVDLYQFSHQTWLFTLYRNDSLELSRGDERHSSCMDNYYKPDECKKRTPLEAKNIIKRMQCYMGVDKKNTPKRLK